MARRYFNWKLLVVLILGTSMLGVTAFGLRKWQKGQKSDIAYEKGIKAFDEHNWDEAASSIGRYISSNPQDVEMLHKYATAQMNRRPSSRDNINQAISAYRMIRRVDKSDLKATRSISELYMMMRVPGEAELILSEYPDLDSNPELGTLLASAMAIQKKHEESAKLLNKIIKAHPDNVSAYAILGQIAAVKPGIVDQPIEYWLDKAVEVNPSSVKAYIIRANYRLRSRDIEGLEADLTKVAGLDFAGSSEKMSFAKILFLARKYDQAETFLQTLAKEDPQASGLWNLLVELARRSNSQEKILSVVRDAQKALELDPWDFISTATEIYLQCNQIEEARECISKLKAKKMRTLDVARFEAMITDRQDDQDPFKSIEAWREVLALASRTPNASFPETAVRMSLAMAYFRADDSAAAVRELTELLKDNPSYWQGNLVLARDAFENDNLLQASEYARKVTQVVPGNTEAKSIYIQSSIQLLSRKDSAASPADLEAIELQIAELSKDPSMAFQAELLKFRVIVGKGDFDAAATIIEKLKVDYPDDVRVAMVEADLLVAQNKIDEIIPLLQQTIQDYPQALEPVQFMVSVLAWKNQQEKCIELVNDAIERNEDTAGRLKLSFILADLYLSWNHQDELYTLLASLSQTNPNDIQVKTRILQTQNLIDDLVKAQEVVDQIKTIAGESSWQWRYHQTQLWYRSENFQDHYSEVVSLLKKNLLENPTDQQSRLLLANSYFKAGDVQLAFSTFRQAFDRSPDDLNIILPMVTALYQAKEFALADEILSKVSSKTMQNSQLSRLKANSYIRQGDYSTASELLRNSLMGKSSTDNDRLTLALLEMEQKNYSESAKMLEGLKSSVSDPDFQQSIIAAQIQLNLRQDNLQEAIKICNELVEANPDSASLLIRARTYASIDENENALVDFNRALEKDPENPDVWVQRSRFYASSTQIQEAIDDMLKAFSLSQANLSKALSLVESINKDSEDTSDSLSKAEADVKKQKNTLVQIQRQTITLLLSSRIPDAIANGRDLLKNALDENPEDIDLMMIKAQLLYASNTVPSRKEAASILSEISRRDPSDIDAWNMLGQIALDDQQNDKAINYAQRGLLSKPGDRRLMLLKARAESGRSPAFAIPTLMALYDLDPENIDNAIFLADTYSKAEQTKKAVDLLEAQLTKTKDEQNLLRCRLALAQAMYRDGRQEEAEKTFAILIKDENLSLATLTTYTMLLADSTDFDKCFKQIDDWIDANIDKSVSVVPVIERLVQANLSNSIVTAKAVKIFQKVLEANPEAPDALQSMAVMYQVTGQNVAAISVYEKIHDLSPDDVVVLNNLAWAYCQQGGKFQRALEMANAGLAISPEYIDLIDTRGYIYDKMGQYEKAIIDFKKCLELYPATNPAIISTRLHLAKALDKSGKKDLAIKELNTIATLKLQLNKNIRDLKKADFTEALKLLNTLSK